MVYCMILAVDARSLTLHSTRTAAVTQAVVYPYFKYRKLADEAQHSSHWAYCVAKCTSVFPRKEAYAKKCNDSNDKRKHTEYHYFHFIECIISETGENRFQNIISGHVNRSEDITDDTSVGTVRVYQA